jgi:drug/metabolite transporter (DMT)-like permease
MCRPDMWKDKIKARKAPMNDAVLAALLTVFAALAFAALGAMAKHLSDTLHGFVVTFWRNFWGLVFVAPWLFRHGLGTLSPARLKGFVMRAIFSLASMLCGFTALKYLTFADATALTFTAPLFATMLAAILLGETVRIRRWSATLVGFAGVLIVLRPGAADLHIGQVLGLSGACLTALVIIVVKQLSRTEAPDAIVAYMVLLLTPMALVAALPFWSWPEAADWPFVIGMGLMGTIGHLAWTRAIAISDASAVAPYDYCRLVFAMLIGMAAFGEWPDFYSIVGSLIIVASGLYIARREAMMKQALARKAVSVMADQTRSPDVERP